ncbi:Symplekin-like protein, partial [Drosera capensis]
AVSEEASFSSQLPQHGGLTTNKMKAADPLSLSGSSEVKRLMSLYFALCTKRPSLLRLVFDIYGQAPKIVKQTIQEFLHLVPILTGASGPPSPELLHIISDPPSGSEDLLRLVLELLMKNPPSPNLIATVIHLYETKLKDATILIPMLSSLSKQEVLPIFPRLVDLPLDKFQKALDPILQGSAHSGPALTPTEALVALHDIVPEKERIALKKASCYLVLFQIMDACSACFEQRMVFTEQVLTKALSQMVERNPLPLLLMRTVIQAIDAYPTLVDFVMEILSKLVVKQLWKTPKLWVGFMKCVSQTQPHSFRVLLQLPPPQLENALNKYPHLRGSLAAYASQPKVRASLSRSILSVLGLSVEHLQRSRAPSHLNAQDTSSSVQGATLT